MSKFISVLIVGCIALMGNVSTSRAAPPAQPTATQLVERAQATLHAAKKDGDYQSAVADLTAALALEPENANAYFWRGEAIRWARRFQLASPLQLADPRAVDRAFFEEENSPMNFDANAARADYAKAIELDPKMARAYFGRAALEPPPDPNISYYIAQVAADLDKAIALDSKFGEAYFRRAYFKSATPQPNLDEVLADYSKALALGLDAKSQDPIYATAIVPRLLSAAYSGRALIWTTKNQNAKALRDLDAAIQNNPDNLPAHLSRARLKNQSGDAASALEDLRVVLAVRADNTDALLLRATIYQKQGDTEEARADMRRALQLEAKYSANAQDAIYHGLIASLEAQRRGDEQLDRKAYEEAQTEYSTAIEQDEKNAAAFAGRATARMRRGDLEGAQTDLDAALQWQPENVKWLTSRGQVLARRGQFDAALKDLGRATQLAPDDVAAWEQTGIVQQAEGEYALAEKSYENALGFAALSFVAPGQRNPTLAAVRRLIVRAAQGLSDDWRKELETASNEIAAAGLQICEIEIRKHPELQSLKDLRAALQQKALEF
jgi:tetratricopeptide (TPR) repeat protein